MLETVAFSVQMPDTICRMPDTLITNSKNIQTSASSLRSELMSKAGSKTVEPYPETRIQDQSILVMVFIATAKFEYSIL